MSTQDGPSLLLRHHARRTHDWPCIIRVRRKEGKRFDLNARMPYTRMRMRVCVLLPERCFRTAKIRGDLQTSEMTFTRFRRHHFTETCRPLSESLPDVATSLRGFSEDLRETSESENVHEIAEKTICMRKKIEKVEACLVFRDRTPPIPAEKKLGVAEKERVALLCKCRNSIQHGLSFSFAETQGNQCHPCTKIWKGRPSTKK